MACSAEVSGKAKVQNGKSSMLTEKLKVRVKATGKGGHCPGTDVMIWQEGPSNQKRFGDT